MDYSNGALEFTFTPEDFFLPYCFPLYIVDDMVVEDQEFFDLTLGSTDDVLFKTGILRVEIEDNDCEFLS